MIKRFIKLVIAALFLGIEKMGKLLCLGDTPAGTCVVLMYHDITKENYSRFIWQINKMIQLAVPIPADSISGLNKGRRHVAVTFDDGFEGTLELVQPILKEKGVPATFFIPTAHLGREATWITNMERRRSVGHIITASKLRSFCLHDHVTIGSHGVNHLRLTELNDEEAKAELTESKQILEGITDRKINLHAFPFGDYDDRHLAMARETGYESVFTVDPVMIVGNGSVFVIGRVEVSPSDWPFEFTLKVLGAYRWHPFVSHLKKRVQALFTREAKKGKNGRQKG
jgi:peptidoglycan/xylan/chitin deacetylase (PgdA/CDA1 family)